MHLSFAKTSAETKNETVVDKEGLNPILASTAGGQEPVCAYSAHIY
jgi:hypothetical protein